MKFKFGILEFFVEDEKIYISKIGDKVVKEKQGFIHISLSGEKKSNEFKSCLALTGRELKYAKHSVDGNILTITQTTDRIQAETTFIKYEDNKTLRIKTSVKNITDNPIVLNSVSAFSLYGFGNRETDKLHYTRFYNKRYAECQPVKNSFEQLGLFAFGGPDGQTKISFANRGNCSSREEIPQGIIENETDGNVYMFSIESNHLWYYEIGERLWEYYLSLGGADLTNCGWKKTLQQNESYETVWVTLAIGKSEEEVLGETTKYRRHISGKCVAEENLPAIFNEYMHLAWDNPYWENTQKYAPIVAKTGVEYYVIDCGWHTQSKEKEEDPYKVYSYIGEWEESLARFPNGLLNLSNYLNGLGMKLGLWIAPEQVGVNCKSVIEKLGKDSFLQRNGELLQMNTNYMLDYRKEKVQKHMNEVIRRMVEDYGVRYIKFDCTAGHYIGGENEVESYGQGLEENANAFAKWVIDIRKKFPEVIFEACAGGGMRLDYRWLSIFSLVSTSDQIDYLKYPYLAGNLLSAVLPEQCAVWAYPITAKLNAEDITDERIYMNMINSFLGRMHLASHLEKLSERQLNLVKDGVDYYNSLTPAKKKGLPKFPIGFNSFTKDFIVAGFETDEKLYLAVWNMGDELHREIPLKNYKTAVCSYPKANTLKYEYNNDTLTIEFTEKYQARFFELEK